MGDFLNVSMVLGSIIKNNYSESIRGIFLMSRWVTGSIVNIYIVDSIRVIF